jgi:hypothetical protein
MMAAASRRGNSDSFSLFAAAGGSPEDRTPRIAGPANSPVLRTPLRHGPTTAVGILKIAKAAERNCVLLVACRSGWLPG